MTLNSGAKLGPYEIVSPLGAGGMGEVYRAKDTRLSREVAIKVLPESMAADAEALTRFEREAKAVAALSHPNILALFDFGQENDVAYAVMELLEGETLRARLNAGMIPPRKLTDYSRQIAEGLAAAHEKGIVHRDLKPENLWVTHDGRMKILDFGLAKVQTKTAEFSSETSPTRTLGTGAGVTLGTVGYMSPEQVRGEPADHRSDIFSFGAVLYEMASGKRAFKGDSAVETMNAILKEEPPEVSVNTTVSSGLDRIIRHCLEKKPGERFQSARDLAFDLASLSGTTGGGAPIAAGAERKKKLRYVITAAVGAALLAAGVWIGGGLSGRNRPAVTLISRRLTFQRGNVLSARFTPDGESVVYSAGWNGQTPELYTVRLDGSDSRPLGLKSADVLSISVKGELAIKLHKSLNASPLMLGTLSRMPISGGVPREVLDNVLFADWDPAGNQLAVIVSGGAGKWRIEYPPGHLLYETSHQIYFLRFSPGGEQLAFAERESNRGVIRRLTVGLGKPQGFSEIVANAFNFTGLDWAPDGREIWFGEVVPDHPQDLRAVDLRGRSRVLLANLSATYLHDISHSGRALVENALGRADLMVSAGGEPERQRSWLDGSIPVAIQDEGATLLFNENQEGGGPHGRAFLYRKGSELPLVLGDGRALDLSLDGRQVILQTDDVNGELTLVPTGSGDPRKLATGLTSIYTVRYLPGGQELLICGAAPTKGRQVFRMKLDGGSVKPITPEADWYCDMAVSPDGKSVALTALQEARRAIYPLDGGTPRPMTGLDQEEIPLTWSGDGRAVYLLNKTELAARLYRYELATGKREMVHRFMPADPAGLIRVEAAVVSPDGRSYAYAYTHATNSDLHLIEGLK